MLAQVVNVTTKPGRVWEVCKAIQASLGIWQAAPGFVDQIVLADPAANHVITHSYWRSQEDADRFRREATGRITALVQELLAAPPTSTLYVVGVSTNGSIAAETGG